MDPRSSKGTGKGGGKGGSPNNIHTNVSANRGLGQTTVAGGSFTTPIQEEPKQRTRTMSTLLSSTVQVIENSVQSTHCIAFDK
jgi:hypothetical protein